MEIVSYQPELHRKWIESWLTRHHMSPNLVHDLPHIGFIAMEGTQGVGCMFLRLMEGPHGLVEATVTNPWIVSSVRHEALELLLEAVMEESREISLKSLWYFTSDISTLERGQRAGFEPQSFHLMTLSLGN